MSIQDIQQNPQDTSNFYLANIYQATINGPNNSSSLPPSPPPFSPPTHAVWVNSLWFLSLVISLTCALLATLLQQWARRYLKITQSRYSPHKRARIRAFFSEGVEKCLLPWTVDALPTLLHISLFLFLAGLVVFLCNVNLTILKLVSSWVGLSTAFYGCITCMPIIRHDSPYYTPLSLPVWQILTGTRFLVYRFLRWFNRSIRYRFYANYFYLLREQSCRKSLLQGMQKTAEETALKSPPEIDVRAFMWTFDCLDEDHELEGFFYGLPGFRSSKVVEDPLPSLTVEEKGKLCDALVGLLSRTFSSDLLPAPVKNRRAMICAKTVDPEHMADIFEFLDITLSKYGYTDPMATGIAKILRGCVGAVDGNIASYGAQLVISRVMIATRQSYDDSWYSLASDEVAIPQVVLRDYAAHGDSLSLIILIHVVHLQFSLFRKPIWSIVSFSYVLMDASNFDIRDTLPKLQHEFCALWNQIVNEAQHGNDRDMASYILRPIRNVFLALHQDTDSAPTRFSFSIDDGDDILWEPSSYPVCKVPGHHPDSPSRIHHDFASNPFTPAATDDHDNTTLVLLLPGPHSPSLSTHAPLPVDETFADAPPVDNDISLPVQTTPEDPCIPSSSNPVTPPQLNVSPSPPDEVAVGRHTKLNHAPSDDLNLPSSPPHDTPVLDATIPTGSLLFSLLFSGRYLI